MARYDSPTQSFVQMYFEAERGRDRRRKKRCNNTWVYIVDPDTVAVKYHYTDICTYKRDGTVIVDTGGWWTVTTRERLNAFSPYYIWQYQNEWFISETYASNRDDAGEDAYPMYGMMRFLPDRRKNPQAWLDSKWVPVPSLKTLHRQRQREQERAAKRAAKERDKLRKARKMGDWLMGNRLCEHALKNWLADPGNEWVLGERARIFEEIEKAILKNPDKLRDDLKRALYENLPTYVREKIIQAYQVGLTDITITGDEIEKRVIEIDYEHHKRDSSLGPLRQAEGGTGSEESGGEGESDPGGTSSPHLSAV